MMRQPNTVYQYNLGTANADFNMVFRQTSVFLQPECFYADNVFTVQADCLLNMIPMINTEFPCFTLKFQYSQCDVTLR